MGSKGRGFANCPLRLSWFLVLWRHQNQALLLASLLHPLVQMSDRPASDCGSANHWVASSRLNSGATTEERDGAGGRPS